MAEERLDLAHANLEALEARVKDYFCATLLPQSSPEDRERYMAKAGLPMTRQAPQQPQPQGGSCLRLAAEKLTRWAAIGRGAVAPARAAAAAAMGAEGNKLLYPAPQDVAMEGLQRLCSGEGPRDTAAARAGFDDLMRAWEAQRRQVLARQVDAIQEVLAEAGFL